MIPGPKRFLLGTSGGLLWTLIWMLLCYGRANAVEELTFALRVAEGDTLIHLGQKLLENPQKWTDLARLNRIRNPNRIYPGQVLIIPVRLLKGLPLDGEISFRRGEVLIQREERGDWRSLNPGDKVFPGNRVQTAEKSAVEVTFDDGTSLFIRAKTELKIVNLERRGPIHVLRDFFLNVGRVITKVKAATGRDSRLEIHTPSAVASARGTEFRVSVEPDDSTRSEVLAGTIYVEAMEQRVELKEEEGTRVRKGEPPMKPVRLLPPPPPVNLSSLYRAFPLQIALGRKLALTARATALSSGGTAPCTFAYTLVE